MLNFIPGSDRYCETSKIYFIFQINARIREYGHRRAEDLIMSVRKGQVEGGAVLGIEVFI